MSDLHPQDVQVDAPACLMPEEDPGAAQALAAAALDLVVEPPLARPPAPLVPPASLQPPHATIRPSQVRPAQEAGTLVYALGTLGYDFGTDARRDWFGNALEGKTPEDMGAMLAYFAAVRNNQPDSRAYAAEALIWTLNLDATPIYALQPAGPYAAEAYRRLRDYLQVQVTNLHGNDVTRVAVPGVIADTVTLRSRQVVPVIVPDLRGLTQSTSAGLSAAQVAGQTLTVGEQLVFRLFYELRNLGVSPQDRARNAMSVLNIAAIGAGMTDMALEGVQVEQSPVCRPGSDCWDVMITAFNPTDRLARARRMFRQTVDVSDVIPVFMGSVRQWDVY